METDRIINEYVAREKAGRFSVYSMLQSVNQFNAHSFERALFSVFSKAKYDNLAGKKFVDIGCGTGGLLLRWIQWGALPENCHGIELVPHRLEQARHRLAPAVHLRNVDASRLPYPDATFDVASQMTVLSSILDKSMQMAVASEMFRVTKRDGLILSYDFWLNPTNPATRGVRLATLRRLFPNCKLYSQRITLAPPITRCLIKVSPLLCRGLERLKLFNSHYLVMIKPDPKP